MAALEQVVDPEVEVSLFGPSYTQIRETRQGIDGWAALWRDWLRPYQRYRLEPEEMSDLGDRVLVLTRAIARVQSDSPEMENAGATIFGVRDGRVTTVDSFLDREDALEAAGLPRVALWTKIGARLHLAWRSLATGPPAASTRSSVSRANETSSELLKK